MPYIIQLPECQVNFLCSSAFEYSLALESDIRTKKIIRWTWCETLQHICANKCCESTYWLQLMEFKSNFNATKWQGYKTFKHKSVLFVGFEQIRVENLNHLSGGINAALLTPLLNSHKGIVLHDKYG